MRLQIELEGIIYNVNVENVDNNHEPAPFAGLPADVERSVPEAFTPRKRRKPRARSNERECRSPMCGTIVQVNVTPGQMVEADDVLLVLEAMKMETNIRAPRSGRVKAVHVTPGESVFTDELMVELE
jgi:biotin carboxyl carrier protein